MALCHSCPANSTLWCGVREMNLIPSLTHSGPEPGSDSCHALVVVQLEMVYEAHSGCQKDYIWLFLKTARVWDYWVYCHVEHMVMQCRISNETHSEKKDISVYLPGW